MRPRTIGRSQVESLRRIVVTRSLLSFVRQAWRIVEPYPFQENWHHKIICSALERVTRRETRKLVICVPPGSTKTLLTGVFWPAWAWLLDPSRRLIHTTYGGALAIKPARQMRDLVNSDWYRSIGGPSIPYQNTHAAKWFENDRKGSRFSGSVGGEVTGRHAHDLIGDDLNKAIDALGVGVLAFDRAWDFWSDVLPTRQADPRLTTQTLVGQRLHRDDVPGRWMAQDPSVERIIIPMWAEPDREDHHPDDLRAEGEIMWPGRFDEEELEELKRMGPSSVAAQLQQRPIPPGGQLLRPEYFERRYASLPGRLRAYVEARGTSNPWGVVCGIYGDATFKGKPTSDFTVFQLWARWEGEYYLLDQIRGQWGFSEARQRLADFIVAHPESQYVRIEDAANGSALEDDLRTLGVQVIPHAGGCLARTQLVEGPCWAASVVHLPANAEWMGGGDGFIAEHLSFDGLGTRHDDQVSTSGLALLDLKGGAAASYAQAWEQVLRS